MQPNDSFQIAYRCTFELDKSSIVLVVCRKIQYRSNFQFDKCLVSYIYKTSYKTNKRDFEARVNADAKSCKFCKKDSTST